MRAIGFLLIIVGIFVVLLGWQGKIKPAFDALMGKGVNLHPTPDVSNSTSLNDNPSGKPGQGSAWGEKSGNSVNSTGL